MKGYRTCCEIPESTIEEILGNDPILTHYTTRIACFHCCFLECDFRNLEDYLNVYNSINCNKYKITGTNCSLSNKSFYEEV